MRGWAAQSVTASNSVGCRTYGRSRSIVPRSPLPPVDDVHESRHRTTTVTVASPPHRNAHEHDDPAHGSLPPATYRSPAPPQDTSLRFAPPEPFGAETTSRVETGSACAVTDTPGTEAVADDAAKFSTQNHTGNPTGIAPPNGGDIDASGNGTTSSDRACATNSGVGSTGTPFTSTHCTCPPPSRGTHHVHPDAAATSAADSVGTSAVCPSAHGEYGARFGPNCSLVTVDAPGVNSDAGNDSHASQGETPDPPDPDPPPPPGRPPEEVEAVTTAPVEVE